MTTETTLPGDPAEPEPEPQATAPASAQPQAEAEVEGQSAPTGFAPPSEPSADIAAPAAASPADASSPAEASANAGAAMPESASASVPSPAPVPTFGAGFSALDPAAIAAEQAQHAQAAARRSRRRRNALRWAAAVAVTLAVGGGTAFALTVPQRTDLPGLGTAADGRYDFPALTLPTLPADQPAPSASTNADAGRHLADVRKLLLPRPLGSAAGTVKSAADGWLTDPASLFVERDSGTIFAQYGLRHTATESWKTGDGATTTVYLLQFTDLKAANAARGRLSDSDTTVDATVSLSAALSGVPQDAKSYQTTPYGLIDGDYTPVTATGTLTRYGSFRSGDVIAIVIQSGPASLPLTPFQQVMTLQAEMLQ